MIGSPFDRVDGPVKLSGAAPYAGDVSVPGLLYGVLIEATIPNGRVTAIDIPSISGVVAVITPFNAPRLPQPESRLTVLQDDRVHYDRQPIAVVVARSLHEAREARSKAVVKYSEEKADLDFVGGFPTSHTSSHVGQPGDLSWGDVSAGLQQADVRIEALYTTPIQHHNPMEPHATVAVWQGDHLTVYDSTQHITGVQKSLAKMFALADDHVHVVCPFTGGGFGCKGALWSHVPLAALAARQVGQPVKLVLERPQMFGPVGARPRTHQQVTLGATHRGRLTAIRHVVHANTSVLEDYMESAAFPTRVMYACPNVETVSRIVPLNLGTPTYMRAPGVATGTYAIEVAMDELAYRIHQDPLELRLLNYTENDPHTHHPFTGKHLRECYTQAAEKFGWSRRTMAPGSMRRGTRRVGWGMATETYPAGRQPATAVVRIQPDGRVEVACGTQELGGGTYTIMAQTVADVLGVPMSQVTSRLGDTDLPTGPMSAGSMTTASVLPAVQAAALQAREKLRTTPGLRTQPIEGRATTAPDPTVKERYAAHSFGAIFVEVSVELGMVHVDRVVAVYDVGRIMNRKTAESQFIGGIVWGISLALHEVTHVDERYGRIVNASLADYHVPVSADVGDIEVSALDIPDLHVDPLGARGIGEIGITGTGAAVANAVFHATGRRVRDLPISPDKLM
ncbi:MAG TPA: xanthine dehydrogenase family protein molybdopterin-binding subunit [Candidatus Xenobia bacterium]|jgi:xanthine dehydrogenase YagR molybdenum-binding subunit